MSYTVLARKYRPQVFADMVGQEHLVKVLTNALASGRVAHAYLFSGPRGVGKTTAARILAKALNCEKGPTPTPCGACGPCTEIRDGRSMDVLEIDGASNRGINEVRELRENVRFAATGGRSKIYIIDEVHMLTQEAFNALLKTLEEPPAHVVFVFATTEPFKVPGTILSRCQRFDFARIPARKITEHLTSVLARENEELRTSKRSAVEANPAALALIARRAQGGLRDALSLLDQVIAAVDGPIERESVESFLGLVGDDYYHALVDRLADGDAAGAITLLDTTYNRGADLRDLSEGLAGYLRDLLLLRIGDELASLIEAPEAEAARLKAQASRFPREVLIDLVDRAADIAPSLRRTEMPRLAVELALAEMAEMSGRMPLGEIAARLLDLESRIGAGGGSPPAPSGAPRGIARPAPSPRSAGPAAAGGSKPSASPGEGVAGGGSDEALWAGCLEAARAKSVPLGSKLAQGILVALSRETGLVLRPSAPALRDLLAECLAAPGTRAFLEGYFATMGLPGLQVVLQGDSLPAGESKKEAKPPERKSAGPAKPTRAPGAGKEDASAEPAPSPAPAKAEPEADDRSMGELFKEEPLLQKALDMFDGEVIP